MTDVVITGFGAITPLGDDAPTTWANLLAGKNGINTIDSDWVEEMPVKFAGQICAEVDDHFSRPEARRLDRTAKLAIIAATEAWGDAGFLLGEENQVDSNRLAVSIGTGIGGLSSLLTSWDTQQEKGIRRVSPFSIPMLMANASAAHVGMMVGAKAGVHTPVSACASGNEAIAQGLDIIRTGRADVVVVGGSEAVVHPFTIAGFSQMQALSKRNDDPAHASRPWDVSRDGFVLGEGAAVMVLESLAHAKARGAKIYGCLAGAGISADSFDIVKPDPSGDGQAIAISKAIVDAKLSTTDICHVNAHATSTPAGDTTEAVSIGRALGQSAGDVVVTGTKSMTGHLLGAAGALETFATVMALKDRVVPPTINIEQLEDGLPVQIAQSATKLGSGDLAAINNSFGFGGHNVSILVTNQHTNR